MSDDTSYPTGDCPEFGYPAEACLHCHRRLMQALRVERDAARDALNRRGMSCTPDQDLIRLTKQRDAAEERERAAEARVERLEAALRDIAAAHRPHLTRDYQPQDQMRDIANAALAKEDG